MWKCDKKRRVPFFAAVPDHYLIVDENDDPVCMIPVGRSDEDIERALGYVDEILNAVNKTVTRP